jgi:hypothetical protein
MLSFTRLNDGKQAGIPFSPLLASERAGDFLFDFRIPDRLLRLVVMKRDVRIGHKHQERRLMFATPFLKFPLFRAKEWPIDQPLHLLTVVGNDVVAPTGLKCSVPNVFSGFLGG